MGTVIQLDWGHAGTKSWPKRSNIRCPHGGHSQVRWVALVFENSGWVSEAICSKLCDLQRCNQCAGKGVPMDTCCPTLAEDEISGLGWWNQLEHRHQCLWDMRSVGNGHSAALYIFEGTKGTKTPERPGRGRRHWPHWPHRLQCCHQCLWKRPDVWLNRCCLSAGAKIKGKKA